MDKANNMIEINKQLIKQVFPSSKFKQLARPTVSQTAINVKPGQWVWEDGQGNTYSLDGVNGISKAAQMMKPKPCMKFICI
ncbi:hypothetical protein [Spartinivicinus poritis]|uniref:Uncharacterized protein n=1 Tax=Spartinivicinus poritis TaxID=2994640 RepID=A0ABT5UJF1_9GAMM|nr:hypothetical protein [Spartinivicinus sp. A2-2]MDE1465657.1 hypothetical protein [Spartinivicinus sp. A2-2]